MNNDVRKSNPLSEKNVFTKRKEEMEYSITKSSISETKHISVIPTLCIELFLFNFTSLLSFELLHTLLFLSCLGQRRKQFFRQRFFKRVTSIGKTIFIDTIISRHP